MPCVQAWFSYLVDSMWQRTFCRPAVYNDGQRFFYNNRWPSLVSALCHLALPNPRFPSSFLSMLISFLSHFLSLLTTVCLLFAFSYFSFAFFDPFVAFTLMPVRVAGTFDASVHLIPNETVPSQIPASCHPDLLFHAILSLCSPVKQASWVSCRCSILQLNVSPLTLASCRLAFYAKYCKKNALALYLRRILYFAPLSSISVHFLDISHLNLFSRYRSSRNLSLFPPRVDNDSSFASHSILIMKFVFSLYIDPEICTLAPHWSWNNLLLSNFDLLFQSLSDPLRLIFWSL